jgi:hypothetical protein
MGVYDRQIASALRMIKARGETVVWRKKSTTTGGTAAKPGTPVPGASHDVVIVFFPIDREYLKTYLSMLDNTEVPTGLLQGFMGQVPFDPELGDTVERGSEVYSILPQNGIEKLDPNGEGAILYTLRFSR